MRNYEIEQTMYRKATELIKQRYPIGWGGAAVIHTAKDNYFTSVAIETAKQIEGMMTQDSYKKYYQA